MYNIRILVKNPLHMSLNTSIAKKKNTNSNTQKNISNRNIIR